MDELQQAMAAVGQKQLAFERSDAAYSNVLQVLAGVVSGEIDRSRVLVNLTDRSWLVTPPGERPGMPAQINGLPICVVAPAEPEQAEPGKGE